MSEDKTVMCLVCGKKFPRGPLDLARHSTAITLMHLASRKPKHNYDYHCSKCDVYFKQQAHLELHMEAVCVGKNKPKRSSQEEAEQVTKAVQDDTEDKAMECMVCGKLFPRGAIDLARHQTGLSSYLDLVISICGQSHFPNLRATAITLRHLVHPRHTAAFHFGCKKCGLHFSTAEHLASHEDHSSCNENMVWPPTVNPGCRCVTREEAARLQAEEAGEGSAANAGTATVKATPAKETKRAAQAAVEEKEDPAAELSSKR